MNYLQDLALPDMIVLDNGIQFMSSEFQNFCETFPVDHITIAPYHLRPNGQAENFVDTFKRASRKTDKESTGRAAPQRFLRVFCVTPNLNSSASPSPTELMVARKVKPVFDELLSGTKRKSAGEDLAKFV